MNHTLYSLHRTPLPLNFATSLMEYPLRSRLITSLYSVFICSSVFTEPTLRPSFPPFSIYRFQPDCKRNEMLSRSNCAQVESAAIIIVTKRDGCPSSSNNRNCYFCMYRLMPQSMSSLTEARTSNALRPNLDSSLTRRIPMRFSLQYAIASHNTGRSSFFRAPERCSSKTLQTSIPLYFAHSDKSLTCLLVFCLSPILETRAYITPVVIIK